MCSAYVYVCCSPYWYKNQNCIFKFEETVLFSVKNKRCFLLLVGVCLAPSDAGQEGAQSTVSTCPPGEDAQPLLWPEGTNWPHSYK